MRHCEPSLTANVYTDPALLDVAGALDVLPALPLRADRNEAQKATGTAGEFAPGFAPTPDFPGTNPSPPDKTTGDEDASFTALINALSCLADNRKLPQSSPDNESKMVGVTGFEPTTSTSRT